MMNKYIRLDKLVDDICNNTEPLNTARVMSIIYNQPTFIFNNCEDCVFNKDCDTHPMHCNSFMTVRQYWEKINNEKD